MVVVRGGSSRTRNDDVIERLVLLPEEIVSLRDKKNKARNIAIREIITSEFSRPFIANKIIWFEEPEFKRRGISPVTIMLTFQTCLHKKSWMK